MYLIEHFFIFILFLFLLLLKMMKIEMVCAHCTNNGCSMCQKRWRMDVGKQSVYHDITGDVSVEIEL